MNLTKIEKVINVRIVLFLMVWTKTNNFLECFYTARNRRRTLILFVGLIINLLESS